MREAFTVIDDPRDTPQSDARLRALHDPARGVAVAEIAPAARRGRMAVADAILRSLGKDLRARGTTRDAPDRWDAAIAWLAGEQITDLIVLRAQLLDRRLWALLLGACAQTRTRLWLCSPSDQLARGHREALREYPARVLVLPADARQLPKPNRTRRAAKAAPPTQARSDAFPAVPDDEFLTFLPACRELLSRGDHQRVRRTWRRGHADISRLLETSPDAGEEQIAARLQHLLAAAHCAAEATCLLRGAQSACLMHHRLMRIDLNRLLALTAQTARRPLTEADAARLRAYTNTRYACAGAIAALTGSSAHELQALNVADLEPGGESARIAGQTYPAPAEVHGILRAHRMLRLAQGAGPDDPLFTYAPGGARNGTDAPTERASVHALQMALSTVRSDTGLLVSAHYTAAPDRRTVNWRRRHGISIQPLKNRRRA